ncbi:ROK family transcriptional regulator [Dactylosporangium sp. NPDC051541]|uniref:ROK family transcriptional regulator n=1 Tax=Dactylosporangium sp. NPDC051541 TaxID=3363977 RepID=UPI0037B02CF1
MSVQGVHALVRRTHEARVLRVLREHGALSRGQIASKVGLSRTTLSEITGDLLSRGAVVVVDTDAARRAGSGRPAELLTLDPSSGQFLGVDLGHTRVRIAVADAAHDIIAAGHATYPAESAWDERLDAAFALIDRTATRTGVSFRALQGVGVGVHGPRPAVPELAMPFAERFAAPVVVDNNTRFAALAEAMTDGPDVHDVLYIRLSDGIGGGLVVGGRLVAGAGGVAGEFGHVTAQPGGDACRCGKSGCLETVASVPAVLSGCTNAGLNIDTIEDLEAALTRGDPVAEAVVERAAAAVGRVVAAAALVLDPAQIVIGGRLPQCAPALVRRVEEILAGELCPVGGARPAIRAARLGDDDGARGAIAALFRQSPLLDGYPDPVR